MQTLNSDRSNIAHYKGVDEGYAPGMGRLWPARALDNGSNYIIGERVCNCCSFPIKH